MVQLVHISAIVVALTLYPLSAFCQQPVGVPDDCDPGATIESLGCATSGTHGLLELSMGGAPAPGHPFGLFVERGLPGALGCLVYGPDAVPKDLPRYGAVLYPDAPRVRRMFTFDSSGRSPALLERLPVSPSLCGREFVAQALALDPVAQGGAAFTKAAAVRFGDVNGAPLFGASEGLPANFALGLDVGDVDGDQLPDLVAAMTRANSTGGATVFRGNGDGTFQSGMEFAATQQAAQSVAIGDLNGDRVADVVVASPFGSNQGRVAVLVGIGGGGFAAPVLYPAGPGPCEVLLDDLDGDGFLDIAVSNIFNGGGALSEGAFSVLFGNGDATFGPAVSRPAGSVRRPIATGDLNGDGLPDVVVGSQGITIHGGTGGAQISLFLSTGGGSFAPVEFLLYWPDNGTPTTGLTIGDFDGDGHADVVASSGENRAVVAAYLGNGDGTFAEPLTRFVDAYPVNVASADLDRDGRLDLVLVNTLSDNLQLLIGNGDGTFEDGQRIELPNNALEAVLRDVNGDLVPDLSTASGSDDELRCWVNRILAR